MQDDVFTRWNVSLMLKMVNNRGEDGVWVEEGEWKTGKKTQKTQSKKSERIKTANLQQ